MSFIASLAAVGTAVGVTGAVAAPLAGAGVLAAGGAALGAGTSAAMGGDPGEGALMGAVTAPFMAPLMPAASAGTAVAENVGANVAENVGANVAENVGANVAKDVGTQAATEVTKQAATQGIEQLAANPLVDATTTQIVPKTVALQPLTEVATPSWGQSLIGNAFNTPVTGTMAKIGGGALENAVYGAGINTGINALTGRPLGENLGTSTLAGGIGGGVANAVGAGVGSSFLPTKVTEFAAKNPGITSTAISLPTSMALNSLTAPDTTLPTKPQQKSQFSWGGPNYTYDPSTYTPNTPSWSIYRPQYYAAGGITDLDGYMSQAQNTPTSGIAQIPNPAEVADPEGYGQESMRMMAHGGVADLGGYRSGGSPNLLQGPGDGVSDDLKATIADRQPARLASGEYIVPSRIVSELGNGSTDAGAKRLDMMVQKVNAGRAKTLGGKKYAKDTKAYKHLPA